MSGTTSKGFPYPTGGDAPNGSAQIQALAAAVDTYLSGTTTLITVASGWANLGGGTAKLQGFKLGNLAVIIGTITNNSSYSGGPFTVATSVPTSLRPAVGIMVHGGVQSTGSALQSARFGINATGTIEVFAPAGQTIGATSFHTLTAVYPVNAT